ncbi:ATP-binding protein [Pelagicoccus mobilis]
MDKGFPDWLSKLERRIGNRSLDRKIRLILTFSGIGLVGFTIVLLALFDWAFARKAIRGEYDSLGKVIALDVRVALLFEDEKDGADVLEAFSLNEGILYSEIAWSDGEVFASNGVAPEGVNREFSPGSYVRLSYFESRVEACEPVWLSDESRSTPPDAFVFLVGDLKPIYKAFVLKSALIVAALLLGGALLRWVVSRMSRLITDPILELAETAKHISKERDFSHRQEKVFDDETGLLVDAFNEMMSQIEERGAIIQSNEERFREYFELGIAGMAILDSDGGFVEANRQLGEMLQVDQDVLLNSRFDKWVDESERDSEASPFDLVKEGCPPGYRDELWLRGEGKSRFFAIVSVRRLAKVVGEQEVLYLALFQDISDRKRAEEELRASKRAAEEANRSKDEFLSVMSHELRTPLNPIIGFVDLLMYSDQDEEQLNMLRSIRRSSEHLLNLITDILDFTRAQGGRLEAAPEPFELEDICRSALEMTERSGVSNDIEVTLRSLELSQIPVGKKLFSDAGKIRQIAINFLSNAIKYNKPGGSVWLDARFEANSQGGVVCIRVEDTGIGIDEQMRELVFEPFTQLDMSLQRKHEGVGLGLSICKRIAECLNGEVAVESEVGVGSVFTARIPVTFVEVELSRGPEMTIRDLKVLKEGVSPSRVLLVEDDLENMRLIEAKLRKLGVGFDWAKNGLDATEKVKENDFDLVLMDVRMPLMDGLEATRVIREKELDEASGRVPIVAMTAHASERMRVECARVGMDGYMSKPIQFDQLENYIKRYLAS